jgi:putative uncharacterized protein FNV0004
MEQFLGIIEYVLKNYGIPGGLLLYFLWKDSKTFEMYRNTMKDIVNELKLMREEQTELKKDVEEIRKFIK